MAYAKEVYAAAAASLAQLRLQAENSADANRARFYSMCPKGKQIEAALSKTAVTAAKAVLNGGNVREHMEALRKSNQTLQQELGTMLQQAGLPADYLEVKYACRTCGDTGYVDGRMCACLRKRLREEAYRQLNTLTPLSLCSFEAFDLGYYSEESGENGPSARSAMARVLDVCKTYASKFSANASSLIFMGGTGLGKTHLSLAIASHVIAQGNGVIYCSVSNLLTKLEREHFGREANENTSELLLACDLLILDDLGTEFRTAFSTAEIYNVINTRQMAGKPTIISTNLTMKELEERYTERFASRILGGYTRLLFRGSDVRLQKRLAGSAGGKARLPGM